MSEATATRPTVPDLEADTPEGADGDRGRRARCMWERTVCTDDPVATIRYPGGSERLCELHYALTLRNLLDVHLPVCEHTAAEHVTSFGLDEELGG